MTEARFNALYTILPNGKVRRKQPLGFGELFTANLKRWLLTKPFDWMVTFRPKKTKLNEYNATKLFDEAVSNLSGVSDVLWSIEADRDKKSTHAHLLIGGDVTKSELAEALNRNEVELPYFEPIQSKEQAIGYVTKYIKRDAVKAFNYINKKQLEGDAFFTPNKVQSSK